MVKAKDPCGLAQQSKPHILLIFIETSANYESFKPFIRRQKVPGTLHKLSKY